MNFCKFVTSTKFFNIHSYLEKSLFFEFLFSKLFPSFFFFQILSKKNFKSRFIILTLNIRFDEFINISKKTNQSIHQENLLQLLAR